jgi:hypothetical protein
VYKTEREEVLAEIENCRKREIDMKNSRAIEVQKYEMKVNGLEETICIYIYIYIYIYICMCKHII